MSWEQREAELEQEVERYQREHDSIITAANKMDPASRHSTDSKVICYTRVLVDNLLHLRVGVEC